MYIPCLLFHSFIVGNLGCFLILVFVNNAAMNMGVQIFLWDAAFNSLSIYPEVELLDHTVMLFLFFEELSLFWNSTGLPKYTLLFVKVYVFPSIFLVCNLPVFVCLFVFTLKFFPVFCLIIIFFYPSFITFWDF